MKIIKLSAIALLIVVALCSSAFGQYGMQTFESSNYPGMFIRHFNFLGELTSISTDLDKQDATFKVAPTMIDIGWPLPSNLVTFESANYPGYYLRHQDWRIKLQPNDNSNLFEYDATFKIVPGLYAGEPGGFAINGNSFESINYPGYYLRHRDFHLWVEPNDNSEQFKKDATFIMRPPDAVWGPAL